MKKSTSEASLPKLSALPLRPIVTQSNGLTLLATGFLLRYSLELRTPAHKHKLL